MCWISGSEDSQTCGQRRARRSPPVSLPWTHRGGGRGGASSRSHGLLAFLPPAGPLLSGLVVLRNKLDPVYLRQERWAEAQRELEAASALGTALPNTADRLGPRVRPVTPKTRRSFNDQERKGERHVERSGVGSPRGCREGSEREVTPAGEYRPKRPPGLPPDPSRRSRFSGAGCVA